MSVHPAVYKVEALEAQRQGTNWTVYVWLGYNGSSNPFIQNWVAQGEVFQISADGRVISYDPNVFP